MKLFDLYCQGAILIRQKPMPLIKAMQNTYKKQAQYRGCKFTVQYNSTNK